MRRSDKVVKRKTQSKWFSFVFANFKGFVVENFSLNSAKSLV